MTIAMPGCLYIIAKQAVTIVSYCFCSCGLTFAPSSSPPVDTSCWSSAGDSGAVSAAFSTGVSLRAGAMSGSGRLVEERVHDARRLVAAGIDRGDVGHATTPNSVVAALLVFLLLLVERLLLEEALRDRHAAFLEAFEHHLLGALRHSVPRTAGRVERSALARSECAGVPGVRTG